MHSTTDQHQGSKPMQSHQSTSQLAAHQNRTESLAITLDAWRRVLVRLDAALLWEQPTALASLLGIVTVIFVLIGWLQPPLITMAALACLMAAVCDYLVPRASQLLLPADWSQEDERRYSNLCSRLVSAWDTVSSTADNLVSWRRDRPQLYLAITVPTLIGFIVLGERINNLFLAYLIVVGLLLTPGLRKSGLPQRLLAGLLGRLRGAVGGGRKSD